MKPNKEQLGAWTGSLEPLRQAGRERRFEGHVQPSF
jgi:hypothetical protein